MNGGNSSQGKSLPDEENLYVMKLYVAGRAPNSTQALANLNKICEEYLPGHHQVDVVDILEDPLQAVGDGVLVTPTLVKLSPPPKVKIIGNLSEINKVIRTLGLDGGSA